jgi:hypothetical protein
MPPSVKKGQVIMTRIAIKDLSESVDLDHQAMTAITGGARIARQAVSIVAPAGNRIVDFPWNIGSAVPQEQRAKPRSPSK